jgi:hypothetical protein
MSKPRLIIFILLFYSFVCIIFSEDFFLVKKGLIEDSLFRLGIFYITPQLTLENMGYTSNIFQYDTNPEPDWTADIGVSVRIATLLGNRFIFAVTEHPYYSFYAENKQEQAWNNEFQFAVYSYLGPFNLKFTLDRNNLRQRPSSEFGIRVRYLTEMEKLTVDLGNQKTFYINLYGENSRLKYKESEYLDDYDLTQLMDQTQYSFGIGFNKVIFSRTVFYLNFEYFIYQFLNYPERNGEGETVSLGFNFPKIGIITGSFQLGYKFYNPENPLFLDYSTPYGTGNLRIVLLKRFRLSFQYLVDNYFSFYQPEYYFNNQSFTGGIEFYLSRTLKLGYKLNTALLSYKNLVDRVTTRKDRIQHSRFFVGIKVFKKMGIGFEYAIYKVKSDDLEFARSYDFFGGYIIYDF